MCGIAAIAGEKINIRHYKTEAMLQKLKQRGPNGQGEIKFTNCWLGHRRLAIIDLELGQQPMTDGHLTITFNGEIYNYLELRNSLKKDGYNFQTKSDTEVILKAYRKWGYECPKYLDGMFAFIIWDEKNKEMFIARDRLGKKPLFYCFDHKNIILASEIKSIIASETVKPKIDYKSIDNYLRVMYIPPWKSVYTNIYQIPPASYAIFKNNKLSLKQYWKLAYKKIDIPYEEAKKEVSILLRNAIKRRIDSSDVEIGTFLSGGIDSSLITLFAAEEIKNKLKVFSVNYSDYEEFPFAKQVCEKINAKHYSIQLDNCLPAELDKIISYFDEPHADTADFPQHLISELASQKVKTVLSGDGADELFLGYKWHINDSLQNNNKNINQDIFDKRLNTICAFTEAQRAKLWGKTNAISNDILAKGAYKKINNPTDQVAVFDLTSHLPGQILTRLDRAGMMHGLEIRSPFLDTALIEFVFNLPHEYKIKDGKQKYIIKDILGEYMPADFVYRRKQGFGAPIEKWLNQSDMKNYIHTKLGSNAKIRSLFSKKNIDIYLDDFYADQNRHNRAGQRLWVLLCLEIWLEQTNITL